MICLRISSKSSSLTILKRRRIERATVGKGQLQLKDVLNMLSSPINDNYDDDKYVDDDDDDDDDDDAQIDTSAPISVQFGSSCADSAPLLPKMQHL